MRLIDADTLLEKRWTVDFMDVFVDVVDVVDAEDILDAPTIYPVKNGKWLYIHDFDGHANGECSVCHRVRIIDNFCPNCGAKMDLDE